MKTEKVLLVSLALNLGLAVGAGFLWKNRPAAPAAKPAPVVVTKIVKETAEKIKTVEVAPPDGSQKFDWRLVESGDYKKYIANLRAIGCPEETIRDIIAADVNKLFETRSKAVKTSTNRFEYWRSGNPFANLFNEESIAKNQALAKERRALLKDLLGSDVPEKPDAMAGINPYETLLDFLPSEKQNQLVELEQKYAARLLKTVKDAQKGDFAEMRKVQAEKDAEMLKVLSPDEKLEYDLRLSQTAMVMRMQMGDFEPCEAEFRAMFKLQKQFDDEYGVAGMRSANKEEADRRNAAQKELNTQMKDVLGEPRYREYKYEQTWQRSSLNSVAKEYNVPKENALKVLEMTDLAQEQADQVRANAALSPEQRQAALDAIRAETEKEAGKLLGTEALQAYAKKGSRISNINRLDRSGQPNRGQ